MLEYLPKDVLNKLASFYSKRYEATEEHTSSEFDNNFTKSCHLYGTTLSARKDFVHQNSEFQLPVKSNNKNIIFLSDNNIYIQFLIKPLNIWKGEKYRYSKNVSELFNIDNLLSPTYSLFEDDNVNETHNPLFLFLWVEKSQTEAGEIYISGKLVDDNWTVMAEWSSDEIATLRPLEPDFWSDLEGAVEIDIAEIEISAPSKEIELDEPEIYSEEKDKKNGTKPY